MVGIPGHTSVLLFRTYWLDGLILRPRTSGGHWPAANELFRPVCRARRPLRRRTSSLHNTRRTTSRSAWLSGRSASSARARASCAARCSIASSSELPPSDGGGIRSSADRYRRRERSAFRVTLFATARSQGRALGFDSCSFRRRGTLQEHDAGKVLRNWWGSPVRLAQ